MRYGQTAYVGRTGGRFPPLTADDALQRFASSEPFLDESIASGSSTRCPSAPRRLARSTATYWKTSTIDSNHIADSAPARAWSADARTPPKRLHPAFAVRLHNWDLHPPKRTRRPRSGRLQPTP